MNRQTLLLFILFLAAVVYFGYFLPQKSGIQEGDEAPDFHLMDERGVKVDLETFRGQVVLLNFWATWCPPCVWEMPSLERLSRRLSSDGLVVLAVSIDEGGWPTIERFKSEIPVSFTILWDATTDVAAAYGTYQLPESYLISKDGIVLKKYLGPREWDDPEIVDEIKELMSR